MILIISFPAFGIELNPPAGIDLFGKTIYLYGIMAALGIVGFVLVLLLVLRAMFPLHRFRRAVSGTLMLPWLLTILISMVSEDTLATLAGILFCTFFLAFRNKA